MQRSFLHQRLVLPRPIVHIRSPFLVPRLDVAHSYGQYKFTFLTLTLCGHFQLFSFHDHSVTPRHGILRGSVDEPLMEFGTTSVKAIAQLALDLIAAYCDAFKRTVLHWGCLISIAIRTHVKTIGVVENSQMYGSRCCLQRNGAGWSLLRRIPVVIVPYKPPN